MALKVELQERLNLHDSQGNELGFDTYHFRLEAVKKEISERVNSIKY